MSKRQGDENLRDPHSPFRFTPTIDYPKLTPEDIQKLETVQRNNKASER